jgi:hypothetical protein
MAVTVDGAGIPGVSGDENVNGPPISGGSARLPGLVPSARLEGFEPPAGRVHGGLADFVLLSPAALSGKLVNLFTLLHLFAAVRLS